jgi:hypothetical protein
VQAAAVAATPRELSRSWPEANSLGVRVQNHTGLPLVCVGVQVGGFVEAGCAALPQHLLLRSSLYTFSLAPRLLTSLPSLGFWRKPSSLGCGPGCGALALTLALTLGCARALLWAGPVLLLKLKLLAQAQGFGHHLPSLASAKLLALASRWPLLLALGSRLPLLQAPTSHWSIPACQFASTSPQSSWTI